MPATVDSEEKVQDFLLLPESDRTFKLEQAEDKGISSDQDMSTGN